MTRILEDDNNNFVFMKLELLICKFVLFLNIQRIQSNNDWKLNNIECKIH